MRAILNRAHAERNALAEVPRFKLLPLNNARHRFLTEEDERAVLAASAPHLQGLVIFLVDIGARLSEALELRWSNGDHFSVVHKLTRRFESRTKRCPRSNGL